MTIPFWTNDPGILINKNYILDLWPSNNMSETQKMNAISRLIILLTCLGFIFSYSAKLLVTGVITLGIIIFLQYNQKNKNKNKKLVKNIVKEGFTNPALYKELQSGFTQPSPANPMSNIMLPEIQDNPTRKAAPPAFNPVVEKQINENTKQMIKKVNPTNSDIDERLFKDLGDNFTFEQSMRNFTTTPNTQIPNDQKAFAEYCYGGMVSCKDGDGLACERNVQRYIPGL